MKDRELLLSILQKAQLSEGQRAIFVSELAAVEAGFKMSPVGRRHAEARAVVAGILKSRGTHKQIGAHLDGTDVYSTKHTAGTEFAESVLGRREDLSAAIPAPIRKKAS